MVSRAAAGDPHACDELVEEFSGLLWTVTRAYGLSAADAADVVQITWLRMVEHLDRLREPAKVGAWLASVARRECLNVRRQRARLIPQEELPEAIDGAPEHAMALIAREREALLWAAFERLAPRDRALLRLLSADPQPSYSEISATLGMPVGSIGPTRARALQRLRRHAEQLGLTDDAAR